MQHWISDPVPVAVLMVALIIQYEVVTLQGAGVIGSQILDIIEP